MKEGLPRLRFAIRISQFAIAFFLFLFLTPHSSLLTSAVADDEPFVGPANWGLTGLMEIPTARVMKENTYRMGAGQVHPYRYYYGAIGLLKGLEVGGRVTEVIGVKALSSGYGNTKDKAIDFKYQFWPEGKYSPALSLGIMDPQGTRLYASQFIVASKQIYPFDFTLGFGNGRFGKRPLPSSGEGFNVEIFTDTKQWLRDAQPFWGIQFSPSTKYSFMIEYNPIRYDLQTVDPAQPKYFARPVPLDYNVGFRWRPLRWTEVDLTYQRGNQIGLNLSLQFDIGQPLVPIYDRPYREKPASATLTPTERMAMALSEQGFSDVGVEQEGDTLRIRAQNDRYFYSMKAVGIVLKVVRAFVAPSIERIRITLTQIGVPLVEVVTTRDDVQDLYAERMTSGEFFYLSKINTDIAEAPDIPLRNRRSFTPGWKPSFQTLLNDPSGFLKYRFGAEGWMAYHPWPGTSFVGSLEAHPLNNISSSNVPPSEAVRSDIVEYMRRNVSVTRLMLDHVYKPKPNVYARFAAGFLEIEYAGLDGEVAMPLAQGRFLIGLQGSLVKKRDPDNILGLKDSSLREYYHVEFLNTRLNIPEKDMAIDLKAGRFLGGDPGIRLTVFKYVKGVTLYAWYSSTDTSGFRDPFNRGYHDKGIGVTIPMRLFEGGDTRTAYDFAISPWTRDVAQDLNRYQNLFDFIGRHTKGFLRKDRKMIE